MPGHNSAAHVVLNGELLPQHGAQISVYNQALFYSFGVYESIEIDNGVSFHLDDHLDRLYESAALIELPVGYERAQLREWIRRLIEADGIEESLLRVIAFGPNGDDSLVYILPGPLPHYDGACYARGTAGITYEGSRPLPQAKTLNTLVNYLALRRARRLGAHEAFLVNPAGCLTEGSRSNLFVVAGGQIVTPPAHEVLSGITRDLVWGMAVSRGIPIRESEIHRDELATIDEFFITSTSMHVMPVSRVDERPIGDGRVGPITRLLHHDFEAYYARAIGREVASTLAAS